MMILLFSKGHCNKKIKYLYFISYLPNYISKKYFITLNVFYIYYYKSFTKYINL